MIGKIVCVGCAMNMGNLFVVYVGRSWKDLFNKGTNQGQENSKQITVNARPEAGSNVPMEWIR